MASVGTKPNEQSASYWLRKTLLATENLRPHPADTVRIGFEAIFRPDMLNPVGLLVREPLLSNRSAYRRRLRSHFMLGLQRRTESDLGVNCCVPVFAPCAPAVSLYSFAVGRVPPFGSPPFGSARCVPVFDCIRSFHPADSVRIGFAAIFRPDMPNTVGLLVREPLLSNRSAYRPRLRSHFLLGLQRRTRSELGVNCCVPPFALPVRCPSVRCPLPPNPLLSHPIPHHRIPRAEQYWEQYWVCPSVFPFLYRCVPVFVALYPSVPVPLCPCIRCLYSLQIGWAHHRGALNQNHACDPKPINRRPPRNNVADTVRMAIRRNSNCFAVTKNSMAYPPIPLATRQAIPNTQQRRDQRRRSSRASRSFSAADNAPPLAWLSRLAKIESAVDRKAHWAWTHLSVTC